MSRFWAASTAALLVLLGGGVALDAACSPSPDTTDAGDGGPVCDPDSGDPGGCACDPNKDKTSPCYTGPLGTQGKGPCKVGTRSCVNGKFTACEGEVTPQPEVCNYVDDDCNGIADDLPEIVDAAVIARCTSPACDQSGMTDAAITCWGPDPGICGAGVKTCKGGPAGGTPTGCNEFIHGGAPEVCNAIDDDCNGLVDDGLDQEGPCNMANQSTWDPDANPFDGGQPTLVLGECVHGELHCIDGGDKCFPSQPQPETQMYGYGCDGKDNDCNGVIDDHACADSYDMSNGYTYCCYDQTFNYYSCDTAANQGNYTSCKLAN